MSCIKSSIMDGVYCLFVPILPLCFYPVLAYNTVVVNENKINRELKSCGFDTVGVITDDKNLETILFPRIKQSEQSLNFFDFRNGDSDEFQGWLRTLYVDALVTDFVVAVNNPGQVVENVDSIFQKESTRQLAALPHRSRWLVLVWTETQLKQIRDQQKDSPLDNVAIMYLTIKRPLPQGMISKVWRYVWTKNMIKLPESVNSRVLGESCAIFPNTKYGLNGRKLKLIGKSGLANYLRSQQNPETGHEEYTGILVEIIREISLMMNFTYTILPPPSQMKNFTWSDFNHAIKGGNFHFGLSHFEPLLNNESPDREVSTPYRYDQVTGIYRRPVASVLTSIPRSLDFVLVYFPFFVVLTASVAIYVLSSYIVNPGSEQCIESSRGHMRSFCRQFFDGYLYSLHYFVATSLGQGVLPVNVTPMSARIQIFVWGLFIVLLSSLITSVFTANSARGIEHLPFQTFSEMVDRGDYSWSLESNIVEYSLFDDPTEIATRLKKHVKRINRTSKDVESLPLPNSYLRSLPNNEVFISYKTDLVEWRRKQPNPYDYVIMKDVLFQSRHALGFPLGSELQAIVSSKISRLHEIGFLSNLYKPSPEITEKTVDKNITKKAIGNFAAYAMGVLLSMAILALFVEIIVKQIQNHKKTNPVCNKERKNSKNTNSDEVIAKAINPQV